MSHGQARPSPTVTKVTPQNLSKMPNQELQAMIKDAVNKAIERP